MAPMEAALGEGVQPSEAGAMLARVLRLAEAPMPSVEGTARKVPVRGEALCLLNALGYTDDELARGYGCTREAVRLARAKGRKRLEAA